MTTPRQSELLRTVPMPSRIRKLPRNQVGYPIPFFVATIDGVRDFRVADTAAHKACTLHRRCWICGQRRRPDQNAFLIGPMCAVNRVTAEPPSHVECAIYAARVCPFLVRPDMVRRTGGLPDDIGIAGEAILRNPGVCLVWTVTDRNWSVFRPQRGNRDGILFDLGDPVGVSWWAHSRPATRDEVDESITSGLPLLYEQCENDEDPAAARRELEKMHRAAERYLPAREPV